MARVKKSALVAFSTDQMFDLVIDVERYQEFLPWCRASTLLSRTENEICAEIEVAKAGISQTFSTCNQFDRPNSMQLKLREGPFKELTGLWEFTALTEDACKISLEMNFEFSGRLINAAFGAVFRQIADTMVHSFCQRAKEIYGD